ADVLPNAIRSAMHSTGGKASFLVLGSGDPLVENEFKYMAEANKTLFNTVIGYDEKLSHRIYAGADFLMMPSRLEPSG
ncbi:hypothetical protein ACEV9B_23765, partial [Vibrio parahaemolyticus]